jgi:hypothetical protein
MQRTKYIQSLLILFRRFFQVQGNDGWDQIMAASLLTPGGDNIPVEWLVITQLLLIHGD